ncbi:MAG TPA: hypothetical protein VFP95_00245, partial [Gammaproteobacteria bacterium]|nr:hypothetical protein [Gammaproteobacteria bacterium]
GGINPLADAYAARYASQPTQDGLQVDVVELVISGVNSLPAYGAVLDYVQDLTPVHSLQVARVANNDLTLQLQLNSSIAQLERAISLGRLLKPAPAEPVTWPAPASGTPAWVDESDPQPPVSQTGTGNGPSLEPAMPVPHTVLRYEYHP